MAEDLKRTSTRSPIAISSKSLSGGRSSAGLVSEAWRFTKGDGLAPGDFLALWEMWVAVTVFGTILGPAGAAYL